MPFYVFNKHKQSKAFKINTKSLFLVYSYNVMPGKAIIKTGCKVTVNRQKHIKFNIKTSCNVSVGVSQKVTAKSLITTKSAVTIDKQHLTTATALIKSDSEIQVKPTHLITANPRIQTTCKFNVKAVNNVSSTFTGKTKATLHPTPAHTQQPTFKFNTTSAVTVGIPTYVRLNAKIKTSSSVNVVKFNKRYRGN